MLSLPNVALRMNRSHLAEPSGLLVVPAFGEKVFVSFDCMS